MLTESIALSVAGGALGVLFAIWAARVLAAFLATRETGILLDVPLDWRVLAFTGTISILTGVLFGLAPALQSTAVPLTLALRDAIRLGSGPRVFWRKVMAGAQVGLSVVLLIGAGLFLRSLATLRAVDTGFDHANVLAMTMDPSLSGYDQEHTRAFYREAVQSVARVAGTRGVALAYMGLITSWSWQESVTVEGFAPKEGAPGPNRNIVGPNYFSTLRIPIVRGREFEERDTASSPHVAIVNESFARFYFGSQDPLGKYIGPGGKQGRLDVKIVGVAKDGKYESLRDEPHRFWYTPYEQFPRVKRLTLYARVVGNPLVLAAPMERALRSLDPNVPVYGVKTLDEQIDEDIVVDRLLAMLATFFSALAAILAAVGVYGVMSFTVTARRREIGIRMALGSRRTSILSLVMREVAIVTVTGIALAVPCALALGHLVAALLYGVKPADVGTICGACVVMAAVTMIAGFLPAHRAATLDPMIVLRWD
jgi:predicted permease